MSQNNSHSKHKSQIVQFDDLGPDAQHLLLEANEARNFSYSPYSNFKVGACVKCDDGSVFRGCNIENCSFTVGTCAERTAYFKAISEGKRKFNAVAIVAYQKDEFTAPCGACRQLMAEFNDVAIYISKPDLKLVMVTSLDELLPLMFKQKEDYTF